MFHHASALTVVTLLGGALLVSVPATAANATCQGRPATIVGTGPDIQGSPGDDVIVTGASRSTQAGEGDDLVCVTPSSHEDVFVFAGPGDDVVDASMSTPVSAPGTRADLGTGVDHYLGGPTYDEVHANGANDDVVGADSVVLEVTEPVSGQRGTYSGGLIIVWSADQDVEIDLDKHVVVAGKVAADIADFNRAHGVAPRVTVRGNDEDNSLLASGCHVHLIGKGGDDYLGGSSGDGAPRFECVSEATMRGGQGDDYVKGWLGRNRLIGNAGNDDLVVRARTDTLLGGSGRDELSGGAGPDVLRGNRGHDWAYGDRGRDVCVAERERRCER